MLNQQEPQGNGAVEAVETPPEKPAMPAHFKVLMVGLDMNSGGVRIDKNDQEVQSWEVVIAILSAALEVAKFHRNLGHGQHLQQQAMKAMEEQQIKAALRQKGGIHV